MWENWILTLALSQDSCVMLGRANPPTATEGVELQYQQLVYPRFSECSTFQPKKRSVSTSYLYKI